MVDSPAATGWGPGASSGGRTAPPDARAQSHFDAPAPRAACCAFTYFMMFMNVSVQ